MEIFMTVTTFQTTTDSNATATVDGIYDQKSNSIKMNAIFNNNDTLYTLYTVGKDIGNGKKIVSIDAKTVVISPGNIPMNHRTFLDNFFDSKPDTVRKEKRT